MDVPESRMMISMISPSLDTELPEFVHDIDDKYICLKCSRILRPPVRQSPCGHRFCQLCCQEMFAEVDNGEEGTLQCPGNEEDCVELTSQTMYLDNATKRELLQLIVCCANKAQGCLETLKWGKLSQHLDICPYKIVLCHNEGCDQMIAIKDLSAHEVECYYFLILCSICNIKITQKDIKDGHKSKCAIKPKPCPFEPLGCKFKGISSKVHKHSFSDISNHNSTVVNAIHSLNINYSDLSEKSIQFEGIISKITINVNSLKTNPQTDKLKEVLKTNVAQLQSNFNELKSDIDSYVKVSEIQPLQDKMRCIQETATTHETRLGILEDGASNTRLNADALVKTQRLESTVGMHDMRLAEFELRFRLQETAAYNGRLIWRIPDYTRRKQDAINGRTLSLYSQPFYSSFYGYKMCARVYLNGDGLGKDTHLSLFFVVMRNEYDALQQWPFRQKVTLSLMDQSGSRQHITDHFRPDPTSSSFRRPVGEMNVASGSPMFAPLSKVENDGYLKDDTLFICVSIDQTDLTSGFP